MVLVCLEYKMISYVLKAQLPSFGRKEWKSSVDHIDYAQNHRLQEHGSLDLTSNCYLCSKLHLSAVWSDFVLRICLRLLVLFFVPKILGVKPDFLLSSLKCKRVIIFRLYCYKLIACLGDCIFWILPVRSAPFQQILNSHLPFLVWLGLCGYIASSL